MGDKSHLMSRHAHLIQLIVPACAQPSEHTTAIFAWRQR